MQHTDRDTGKSKILIGYPAASMVKNWLKLRQNLQNTPRPEA
jgi:hypothetical protein